MGEIADMMLEGDMCPCGEFIHDGGGSGFTRYCSPQCAKEYGGVDDRRSSKGKLLPNSPLYATTTERNRAKRQRRAARKARRAAEKTK